MTDAVQEAVFHRVDFNLEVIDMRLVNRLSGGLGGKRGDRVRIGHNYSECSRGRRSGTTLYA